MSPLTPPQARMCQDGYCGLVGSAELVSHHLASGQGSYMLTEALAACAQGSTRSAACSPAPGPPLRPGPSIHCDHGALGRMARRGGSFFWELRVGMDAI